MVIGPTPPGTGVMYEAFSDTVDSAKLLTQFMKFHRRQSSVAKFKGAMSDR